MYTYTHFPKFSPSSKVSGSSESAVSGSKTHKRAPNKGNNPNIIGGSHNL